MKKYSITIAGHRTSISLEEEFWAGLAEAAKAEGISRTALVTRIDKERKTQGLSSALRLHVLEYYKSGGMAHGKMPGQLEIE